MADPIPLRAHNVLCLQGFRGLGYSPRFVEEMAAVRRTLDEAPESVVRLLDGPDRLCSACPNRQEGGCTLGGPGHEAHMAAQDREVLRRLGFGAGDAVPWWQVLQRIRQGVCGHDLPDICTTCPWLPLGWCAEGIDRLRSP